MLVFQFYELLFDQLRWLRKYLSPVEFQAVVFDLGGVYLKYKDRALVESAEQIAQSNDPALGRMFQDYELGAVSFEAMKRVLDQRVNGMVGILLAVLDCFQSKTVHEAEIENGLIDHYSTGRDEHISKAIERLRAYGFKIALLTNVGFVDDQMKKTSVPKDLSQFDVVVESCRVRLRKPNPRIYELTAKRLGVRTRECLFIDDLPRHCRGAEVAGMKSIQVNGGDTKRTVDQMSRILGLDLF